MWVVAIKQVQVGFAVACALWMLSGCAGLSLKPASPASADEASTDELIASDFAHVMVQLAELLPATTTIQFDRNAVSDTSFGGVLLKELRSIGYGIQLVPEQQGERYVSYRITENEAPATGKSFTYEVSLGNIGMRRDYIASSKGSMLPATTMLVRGADASQVRLNEQIFDMPKIQPVAKRQIAGRSTAAADGDKMPVMSVEWLPMGESTPSAERRRLRKQRDKLAGSAKSRMPDANKTPVGKPLDNDLTAEDQVAGLGVKPDGGSQRVSDKPGLADMPMDRLPVTKQNVRVLGGSNFAEFLADYNIVSESILVFGSESTRLNKRAQSKLAGIVDTFNTERDVFSIIGCSHGPASSANANAVLAVGRANRVREALLLSGIPNERIVDEGCWGDEYFDQKMPRSAAVLTLKRLAI